MQRLTTTNIHYQLCITTCSKDSKLEVVFKVSRSMSQSFCYLGMIMKNALCHAGRYLGRVESQLPVLVQTMHGCHLTRCPIFHHMFSHLLTGFHCLLQHVKPRLAELLPVYNALLQAFDNGSLGAATGRQ
jgi:hypothetical protein